MTPSSGLPGPLELDGRQPWKTPVLGPVSVNVTISTSPAALETVTTTVSTLSGSLFWSASVVVMQTVSSGS